MAFLLFKSMDSFIWRYLYQFCVAWSDIIYELRLWLPYFLLFDFLQKTKQKMAFFANKKQKKQKKISAIYIYTLPGSLVNVCFSTVF